MEFFDRKGRDPEDWIYIIKKPNEIVDYPSKELVRELAQTDKNCIYRIKVKDLKVGDGFCNESTAYISHRAK